MPWPERRPPTLEELILYVVGRSRDRGATLTRTKLVKLLYLIDVARAEGLGRTLTGLQWRFLHYGPRPRTGGDSRGARESGGHLWGDVRRHCDFELAGRTEDTFNHPPVSSLKLESTEAAVLARTKWERPVVIVGGSGASDVTPKGNPTHHDILWTVPIYGSDQYSEEVVRRIRMYDFQNLFYLSDSPAFDEDSPGSITPSRSCGACCVSTED
jgi:hypothetical protein